MVGRLRFFGWIRVGVRHRRWDTGSRQEIVEYVFEFSRQLRIDSQITTYSQMTAYDWLLMARRLRLSTYGGPLIGGDAAGAFPVASEPILRAERRNGIFSTPLAHHQN
jgi:hypothetical protein